MTEYITTADAATLLGCTPAHIRLLLARGDIKGKKAWGGAWMVSKASAEKYKPDSAAGRPRKDA